jgi:hypothetical protein
MDLVSVYRDAIARGDRRDGALVNEEIRGDVAEVVRGSTPELNLRGSAGSSRPASRCWSSTSRCRWRSRA